MDEAERFAYGRLRFKPWEFDEFTIPEFVRAKEGYLEEQEDLYKIILTGNRMVAYTAHRVVGGKAKTPVAFWPMWFDKENGKKKSTTGYPTGKLSAEDKRVINEIIRSKKAKEGIGHGNPFKLKHANY